MREILFRGKRVDNGEWIYGDVIQFPMHGIVRIIEQNPNDGESYGDSEIDCDTLGQYTGLTDKNGRKIFEGDIVKHESGATVLFHKVVFERRNGCAYFGAVMGEYETWGFCNSFPPTLVEIVGNIHDNPELLEEEEK